VETGLVERARSGDADAFDALIEPRVEAMLRTATAIIGDPDEAREATQEALLTIWRELPSLRLDDRFDAWAGRILVNRCFLALKRRARRSSREVPLDGSRPAASIIAVRWTKPSSSWSRTIARSSSSTTSTACSSPRSPLAWRSLSGLSSRACSPPGERSSVRWRRSHDV